MIKTVKMDGDLWLKLYNLKLGTGARSLEQVISDLYEYAEKTGKIESMKKKVKELKR